MAKQISSLSVVLGATVKPFVSAFNGLKSTVSGFVGGISGAAGTLLKMTGIGSLVAGAFAAIKGAASGISLAAELEQTSIAFETMLGSASQAQAMMAELQTFAAATPFEFPEIAASAKKLLAFGVAASDINGKLSMLGDISAGTGKPLGEMAALFGKIKSRGQLTGETLNQLAEAGVPIYSSLAKQLGINESAVAGYVTAGKVGFAEVDGALAGLTKTGGRFAGLMDKQSRSLGGLWSTLSDNIGMTVAGIVTAVVDAFGLKAAMSALIKFTGTAGAAINSFVTTYSPIVVAWASSIYAAIARAASAIYGYVAPIVGSIYGVIESNWNSIVTSTVAMGISVYSLVAGTLTAAWQIVSAAWTGIVTVWDWACSLVGYQTADTGSTVGNVFQTIIDASNWLRTGVSQSFAILAFGISHFGDIVAYVGTSAGYYLVSFANDAEWAVNAAIEYVKWFASNLGTLILDAMNNTGALLANGVSNLVAIIKNLPGLIAGTTSLSDVFTPLTDGFVSNASQLPTIAARIPGELEAALGSQSDQLGASLVDGAMGALDDLDRSTAATTNAIASTVGGIGDQLAAAQPPAITTPKLDTTGVVTAADAMDNLSKKTDKAAQSWEALSYASASAEAQHAREAFGQLVNATSTSSVGSSAAAASSVPKAATQAMAKAATEKTTGKDDLTAIVRAILEQVKGMDRVELGEAA